MPLVRVANRRLELSNLDKRLFPSGFTKAQVIDYYRRIAPAMLPHLKGRGITLKRYPHGAPDRFFFEKQCPEHRPPWVKVAPVPRVGGGDDIDYCLAGDLPTLLWLANLAAIELHVPLARARTPDKPQFMVFDLDPGEPADILDCARLGLRFRDVLARLDLKSFAKTSGSKGLHVYVPLNTSVTFEQTREFSRAIALIFERENPKQIISDMKRSLRKGKVFIDWSQNDPSKTTVCVYSLRAKIRPTVSVPVTWEEVRLAAAKRDASRLIFEADAAVERFKAHGDLFAPVLTLKQKLPRP